ncbi:hypothetical protein C8R45DRAFT_1096421 [Mycena sanguinolenta]|nr:hypothetical protein C8R45DRAFT_1096421 [Mycena sanguinolenta]
MAAAQAAAQAAELSGDNQIISIYTPSLRQRKYRKRKGVVLADRPRLAIGRPRVARWRRHRSPCGRGRAVCTATDAARVYPALRPPDPLPAALALLVFIPRCAKFARRHRLVACLPSLFATAVATPLAATLLAHHAPGIAHNHLAAVRAPPEPPPFAIPAVPNVAR